MKNLLKLLILVLTLNVSFSQVIYKKVSSEILGVKRGVKILLPREYDADPFEKFPVLVVLDGEHLFEAITGSTEYLSYWEEIPRCIVVGVTHGKSQDRTNDLKYSELNDLPIYESASFFEFLGKELLPYIDENYKTSGFSMIAGHGDSANFSNYFLLKQAPVFNAYITLSPKFAPSMVENLTTRFQTLGKSYFYYVAAGENEKEEVLNSVKNLESASQVSDTLNFKKNIIKESSFYNTAPRAVAPALDFIFDSFKPISKKEYKEVLLEMTGSPTLYLDEKYSYIREVFGVKKRVLTNDIFAVAQAIEESEQYEHYELLSKIARDNYPEMVLGSYYLAMYYEKIGEPKKAMIEYMNGYGLYSVGPISSDYMFEKAEAIKADFGY